MINPGNEFDSKDIWRLDFEMRNFIDRNELTSIITSKTVEIIGIDGMIRGNGLTAS